MSTKETIVNSCNNLYKNNVITKNQLKSCISIDSDYKKKTEYANKVLGDDISIKNLNYTNKLKNIEKKYNIYIEQYRKNRLEYLRNNTNCLYKKRADIFRNRLNELNTQIRTEIKNITNEYDDRKYETQYDDLLNNYRDIGESKKEIKHFENKISDLVEKKNQYSQKLDQTINSIFYYIIIIIITLILLSLALFISYKLINLNK